VTASTLLLPGVDQHGAGLRVRIRFGAYRHTETGFTTPDQANRRALELKEMRRRGQVPDISPEDLPLAKIEACSRRRRPT
jgi:hypothetical protein